MAYLDGVVSAEDVTFPLPEEPSCAFCSVPEQLKWVTFSTHAALTEHYKARHPDKTTIAGGSIPAFEYESSLEEFEVFARSIEEREHGL